MPLANATSSLSSVKAATLLMFIYLNALYADDDPSGAAGQAAAKSCVSAFWGPGHVSRARLGYKAASTLVRRSMAQGLPLKIRPRGRNLVVRRSLTNCAAGEFRRR